MMEQVLHIDKVKWVSKEKGKESVFKKATWQLFDKKSLSK